MARGRIPRRLRHVGAQRRLGSRQHLMPRRRGRRRMGDQRQQVLVHLRRWRGFHYRHRADEAIIGSAAQAPCRHQSMFLVEKKRGKLPPGLQRLADSQDWLLRLEDLGARLRQSAGCRPSDTGRRARRRRRGPSIRPLSGLETARAHTAARAIGLARGRSKTRSPTPESAWQFGQPIGDFQAIRFKIADMATEIEAARQLNYFVCEQIDTRQRCDKEASMVKLFASEMAERVTSEGMQIHGGARLHQDFRRRALLARCAPDQDSSRAPRKSRCASSPTRLLGRGRK